MQTYTVSHFLVNIVEQVAAKHSNHSLEWLEPENRVKRKFGLSSTLWSEAQAQKSLSHTNIILKMLTLPLQKLTLCLCCVYANTSEEMQQICKACVGECMLGDHTAEREKRTFIYY